MYIKKILVAFLLAVFLLAPGLAYAQNDYGAGVAADKAGLKTNKLSQMSGPAEAIGLVINVALSFIGILFFVLILYAGFTWMTAMGGTEKVEKAKGIIEAAIIGLVLVGAAYAIANFVFDKLGSGSTPAAGAVTTCPSGTIFPLCEGKQVGGQVTSPSGRVYTCNLKTKDDGSGQYCFGE